MNHLAAETPTVAGMLLELASDLPRRYSALARRARAMAARLPAGCPADPATARAAADMAARLLEVSAAVDSVADLETEPNLLDPDFDR